MGACEFVPPLVLHGTPLDRAVGLTWELTGTLPATSTWRVRASIPLQGPEDLKETT